MYQAVIKAEGIADHSKEIIVREVKTFTDFTKTINN
jgi:hypothetical protein